MTETKLREPIFMSPKWWSEIVVSGARYCWRAGGVWERLFILIPAIWAAYVGSVELWIFLSSQPFPVWFAFTTVAASFIALQDAWLTPILSAKVLRALIGTRHLQRDEHARVLADENARVLADYLDSLGYGGRWSHGNLISLGYLFLFIAWGLFAVAFPSISSLADGWIFFALNIAFTMTLFLTYRRLLVRFFIEKAAQKGYRVRKLKEYRKEVT